MPKKRRTDVEYLLEMGRRMEQERGYAMKVAQRWVRVRDRRGRMIALEANTAQRAYEQRRGQHNIVLKARQMGMTTWAAAQCLLFAITHPGVMVLEVAHTRDAAESLFAMTRRMWGVLPLEMREGALRLERSNSAQMVFAELGSELRIASAAEANAGRGLSLQMLHCSEVGRWPGDATETLAGLRAALAPEGQSVLESTPQGAYGAFYEEWMSGDAVRHFMPWWMERAYVGAAVDVQAMSAEELALVRAHGLSAEQIGFRRGLEKNFRALRAQEFAEDAESCFRATGACCFAVEAIEARLRDTPGAAAVRRGGALRVWLPARAGRQYLVAVDTAGGVGEGDFAAVQVLDIATGMQCAELQERLRPAELARVVAALAREYGEALVAVERNNHGAAVIAYLETQERYGRLYRLRGEAGWLTTSASKPEMIARLDAWLGERAEAVMSERLLRECRSFVVSEGGRMGAAAGRHDDLVMAMALGLCVRAEMVG
ncbi:terminase [Granulicella cerasi]|uniref:Terminase n=1 Tax=Granulicella cerasi TaxID=741063 RepID=A0ABW1ZBA4_9BACT|nr:terminase [Granulicella cerasi]